MSLHWPAQTRLSKPLLCCLWVDLQNTPELCTLAWSAYPLLTAAWDRVSPTQWPLKGCQWDHHGPLPLCIKHCVSPWQQHMHMAVSFVSDSLNIIAFTTTPQTMLWHCKTITEHYNHCIGSNTVHLLISLQGNCIMPVGWLCQSTSKCKMSSLLTNISKIHQGIISA